MKDLLLFISLCALLTLNNGAPQSVEQQFDSQQEAQFTAIADLGIDYTDDEVALVLRQALANATLSNNALNNQYSDNKGHAKLLNAIAKMYSVLISRELDPQRNIVATVGSTEALNSILQGFTSSSRDEWIIIEPFWTKYLRIVTVAHGVPRFTNLKLNKSGDQIMGNDWILDRVELESLFNNRTRGIIYNNPQNPIGKLYSIEDIKFIVSLAEKWDTIIIADEVHEWITYDSSTITRMATIPGAFERTITVGSASKSFNVAGWRIGWAYGPENLINQLAYIHEYLVSNAATPQQIAIAYAFEEEYKNLGSPDTLLNSNLANVTRKRDFMMQAFRSAGMIPVVPNGGYCMIATWPYWNRIQKSIREQSGADDGEKFANWMFSNIGVLGLPVSHFYSEEHQSLGYKYIRFCLQKKNETLYTAAKNLQALHQFERVLDTP